eukprot:3632748-Rhodomonas_salina.1
MPARRVQIVVRCLWCRSAELLDGVSVRSGSSRFTCRLLTRLSDHPFSAPFFLSWPSARPSSACVSGSRGWRNPTWCTDVAVKEAGVVAFNQLRIEVQAMRQDVGDVMDRLAVLGNLTQTVQYQAMHPDHQTQRSRESQFHFKSALIKYYEAGYCKSARHFVRADDPEQATYIQCAVTGWKLKRNKCIAGHVLPHASAHLAHAFGLSPEGINDVRN